MTSIESALKERILLLDGAMGTMIQARGLEEADFHQGALAGFQGLLKGDNDVLNLSRPDIISDIHRRYLDAGADIIETNTFNANRISQAEYHMESLVRDMNLQGARLARQAADEMGLKSPDRPRFVAGSVGPTSKSLSISSDVMDPAARSITFEILEQAFTEQMTALVEGGVDALLIETAFDALNVKAALYAARKSFALVGKTVPLMVSATISGPSGRILSGEDMDAFWTTVSAYDIMSVGLNCSFGAKEMLPHLRKLAHRATCLVSAHPNAGLPNSLGCYEQTPQQMAQDMRTMLQEGLVNIIGGCCGTTDAHISALDALLKEGWNLRQAPGNHHRLYLSGLDDLEVDPQKGLVMVGERCNVCGSRRFLRLIAQEDYSQALSIAREQVLSGAQVLDINMDDALLDAQKCMSRFLLLSGSDPDICKVPMMVDSSNWNVLKTAIRLIQGKPVVNSISLKEGEDVFLERAREIHAMGAAMVVMAFDEKGQADTFDRKIQVCRRSYDLLTTKAGIPPEDIILDPNILSVATGIAEHDAYGLDFIRATAWIRQNLPYAHVSGGVSNLSFSFRGNDAVRKAMHGVFLYHALKAGMDMAILNPAAIQSYDEIPLELRDAIEDVILNRRSDATERLIFLAENVGAASKENKMPSDALDRKQIPLSERLSDALQRGDDTNLEADLDEALALGMKAVEIIQGPLMSGMDHVGRLFSEGKMFLPQVVKTARTMKQAVTFLEPHLKAGAEDAASRGRMILATVKGDVHDIGKNIVAVVMSCNGFEVVDLGTMVSAERIVSEAKDRNADMVGLSGLITPSLAEMVHVAALMEKEGMEIPLLIGGAATSREHTERFILPAYPHGVVIHVDNASEDPVWALRLMDLKERAEIRRRQDLMLPETFDKESEELISLKEARNRRPRLF